MSRGSLLLVDDDRHILDSMAHWLRDQGFEVATAWTCEGAEKQLKEKSFGLVLCDIRLPDGDGFRVLAQCREHHPETEVMLMTGYATVETGVEALRAGAFDLLTKPLIDQELLMGIERALSQRKVLEENENLRAQLDIRFGMDNIVGHDTRMRRVFDCDRECRRHTCHRFDHGGKWNW